MTIDEIIQRLKSIENAVKVDICFDCKKCNFLVNGFKKNCKYLKLIPQIIEHLKQKVISVNRKRIITQLNMPSLKIGKIKGKKK